MPYFHNYLFRLIFTSALSYHHTHLALLLALCYSPRSSIKRLFYLARNEYTISLYNAGKPEAGNSGGESSADEDSDDDDERANNDDKHDEVTTILSVVTTLERDELQPSNKGILRLILFNIYLFHFGLMIIDLYVVHNTAYFLLDVQRNNTKRDVFQPIRNSSLHQKRSESYKNIVNRIMHYSSNLVLDCGANVDLCVKLCG